MMPPPDRINYAEMKVQRIQIPVQVAVLKPVYVDCPYPSYVFVEGESQAKLLEKKYGNWKQFLNEPQLKTQIMQLFSDSDDSDSEQEKKKKKKVKSSKTKALVNTKSSKEIKGIQEQQQQVQQQQIQPQQFNQTYSQTDQNNNYVRPPIFLDDRGANFQKQYGNQTQLSRTQLSRTQTQNFPALNVLQTRNETIPNNASNVSRGRQDLQNYKTFLQKSQQTLLPAGEAGKSRYEYQNV
ncbi:unnamed protein product [Paramecium octaurelia]|uniref:Uncharacterized protein n=1 Tax=Paramecium octaurelia TaxID=43137 RepID=A0A8S1XK00_PAROT|nr:unnamed protein product [Paramecium octaurelia]